MQAALQRWGAAVRLAPDQDLIAMDSKTLRRSHDRAHGHLPVHLVQAWAVSDRLWLGQVAVRDHENEITALPPLRESLALQGCTVTLDRAPFRWGCPRQGDQIIMAQGDHYVLALKDN